MIAEIQPAGPLISTGSPLGVATLLRETRVKLGRDIAVAASTLRIRQPYLQAIEDGRFQDLPGATYAVGFVRGYAEYLGLDGNEVVRRFKQENNDLAGRAELVFPTTASGSSLPTGALVGIALIGAAIAYGVWYWLQDRNETVSETVPPLPERLAALIHKPVGDGSGVVAVQEAARAPNAPPPVTQPDSTPPPVAQLDNAPPVAGIDTPPPPAALGAAEPEPVAAPPAAPPVEAAKAEAKPAKIAKTHAAEPPKPEGDNPTIPAEPASASATPAELPPVKADAPKPTWRPSKRVLLRAEDTCWIKIRDSSGQMVLSRLLHKGDVFSPPDRPGLEMTVGSAGALTVLVDGKTAPSLGAVGVVRHVGLDPDKLDAAVPAADTPASGDHD